MPYEQVCREIVSTLAQYGIHRVRGDQYCYPVIKHQLEKRGITYEEFPFGARTRGEIFGNLKCLLGERKIELPDLPELLRQLRSLEERKEGGGRIDIRPAGSGKDDMAVAVAMAAHELSTPPKGVWVSLIPAGKSTDEYGWQRI